MTINKLIMVLSVLLVFSIALFVIGSAIGFRMERQVNDVEAELQNCCDEYYYKMYGIGLPEVQAKYKKK